MDAFCHRSPKFHDANELTYEVKNKYFFTACALVFYVCI